jgi:16S rRNA G966 N2-methylase RsmD
MLQTTTVDIDLLIPDPNNARKHDKKNIDAIIGSLKKFKQVEPLVVRRQNNVVIGGNGRLEAMKQLGYKEVVVHYVDFDDQKSKALALALNRTSELATWDMDVLGTTLQGLREDDFDLGSIGFDTSYLDEILKPNDETPDYSDKDADAVPDTAQNEFGVKRGDIWILGNHRLMCGDSTNAEDVARLMDGQKADMVFTDPPYGMSAVEKSAVLSKRYKPIIGDENTDVVKSACKMILALNIPTILWGANYYSSILPDASCWIVWDKNNGGSDQTDCELAWTNFKGVVRQFTQASEKKNRVHPTQKPITLMEYIFNKYESGKNVLDLFLGSGSTLIACEKTGRRCFGSEIDPHYCSVIIKRWQDFTGKKAIRQN